MTRKALFIAATLIAVTGLTGCDLYFGPPGGSDCSAWNCGREPLPQPPPEPGSECSSNDQCAPGCYCSSDGICQESGFCELNRDCPTSFECDPTRATCIPEGSRGDTCADDSSCPMGSFCDLPTNTCVPSWTCTTNEECGPGWECSAQGTCVPGSCTGDADCFEGCACDPANSQCAETGFCESDQECAPFIDAAGNSTPMQCDLNRRTCTWPTSEPPPPPPPAASCGGPLTCAVAAPQCAADSTPAIADGCYTGECILRTECDVAPLALCHRIQNPNQCLSRPDCEVNYTGMNCTCNGEPCVCSDDPMACTCESYEYSCSSIP